MAEAKIKRLNPMGDDLTFQIDENGTPVSKLELSVPVQREERSFKFYNSVSGGEHTVEQTNSMVLGYSQGVFPQTAGSEALRHLCGGMTDNTIIDGTDWDLKRALTNKYVELAYVDEKDRIRESRNTYLVIRNGCYSRIKEYSNKTPLITPIWNGHVLDTKPYKRKKPRITVLGKEKMKFFLKKASESSKGEISGLKYNDFNLANRSVRIVRQVTADPVVSKGDSKIVKYRLIKKPPKTPNSYRTLRVPEAIMDEIMERKRQNDLRREQLGDKYIDNDYLSCAANGLLHLASSLNNALSKLCSRNGLPHLTVHSLRHMYATILTEQGVPLVKVSALLGHSSIHTTFEYYCEVMDEQERIISFMNESFVPEEGEK